MNQSERIGQYRLHHLPFMMMWVASFGIAWLGLFVATVLWYEFKYELGFLALSDWVYANARWLDGLLIGAGLGLMLSLVQPWLMRWRYGFAPRYWRISTFLGALLGGSLFSQFIYGYGGYYNYWASTDLVSPALVWFGALTLVQTLALWPVARRAWLFPLAGLGAAAIGISTGYINAYDGLNPMNILFFGSIAQAVFSGALLLWLMRDYRVEAVPKRDEKSKGTARLGLHPMSFIALWMMAHLFGLVAVISLMLIVSIIPFVNDFLGRFFRDLWFGSLASAFIIGGIVSLAQPWLMKQQSGYQARRWMLLSVPVWLIAGLSLAEIVRFNSYNMPHPLWVWAMFTVWFGLPPIAQAFLLGRDLRGAWLYGLSGLVSAVLAWFVYHQFAESSSSAVMYAFIFSAGLQALLTGTAFLSIVAQNRQTQAEAAVTALSE